MCLWHWGGPRLLQVDAFATDARGTRWTGSMIRAFRVAISSGFVASRTGLLTDNERAMTGTQQKATAEYAPQNAEKAPVFSLRWGGL